MTFLDRLDREAVEEAAVRQANERRLLTNPVTTVYLADGDARRQRDFQVL